MVIASLFFYLFAALCVACSRNGHRGPEPGSLGAVPDLGFCQRSGLFVLMGAEFLAMILMWYMSAR